MTANSSQAQEPRPLASLGAGLLARKGDARPAMRRQVKPSADADTPYDVESLDDLGWNDMGADRPHPVTQLTPSFIPESGAADLSTDRQQERCGTGADGPVVKEQLDLLIARLAAVQPQRANAPKPAAKDAGEASSASPRRAIAGSKPRVAFTLRLDAERHTQLRLAATVRNRSAQRLVTEALDKLLAEIPELPALMRRVKRD